MTSSALSVSAKSVTVTEVEKDGDALTFIIVSQKVKGVFSFNGIYITHTPNSDKLPNRVLQKKRPHKSIYGCLGFYRGDRFMPAPQAVRDGGVPRGPDLRGL